MHFAKLCVENRKHALRSHGSIYKWVEENKESKVFKRKSTLIYWIIKTLGSAKDSLNANIVRES